jgi:hypothetical protein
LVLATLGRLREEGYSNDRVGNMNEDTVDIFGRGDFDKRII